MLAVRLDEIEKAATKANLKSVSISGDCILGMPPGPAGIRLGTFLNILTGNNKKAKQIDGNKLTMHKLNANDWRVGIDFGSGFSKYAVIDSKNKMIKCEMFNSGIDYPHLLKEIKQRIGNNKNIHFAVAGVGGDNPHFKEFTNIQTTEISALIQAVRSIGVNHKAFSVIDIGTQDVKVLKFNDINEEPWVNTNKSCGAGTGMVLKQILERWQQTNPEIKFTDLDEMAFNAKKSELVNTTCGIFAVTNVVSALVQSSNERRKEILRGVYEYIAEQAVRLLPQNEKQNGYLLLTGGIANHKTLQVIFIERGFNLIQLPIQLHPQYLVAYGTALTIN
jgi:activator of 2-hydroxyglutaryl-CoA dehydratase